MRQINSETLHLRWLETFNLILLQGVLLVNWRQHGNAEPNGDLLWVLFFRWSTCLSDANSFFSMQQPPAFGVVRQHTWRQRYNCNLNLGIDLSASYLIASFHVSSLHAVSHLTLTFSILMETLKAKNHCKGRKCKVWSLSAAYYKIKLLSILCVTWGFIYWSRVASSYQKIL